MSVSVEHVSRHGRGRRRSKGRGQEIPWGGLVEETARVLSLAYMSIFQTAVNSTKLMKSRYSVFEKTFRLPYYKLSCINLATEKISKYALSRSVYELLIFASTLS